MALALFDLDNTLLAGDSDHLWGEFLCEQGFVDPTLYKQRNDQFYQDYKNGSLDIQQYLAFALEPLTTFSLEQLTQLHQSFMQQKIIPIIAPHTAALLQKHREQGDTLVVITATNRFITAPIVAHLGIEHLLATEAECIDDRYTGRSFDTPCFQEGKVVRLQRWLQQNNQTLAGSYFYSDSCNDLPLLQQVTYPYVVDGDDTLIAHAKQHDWPCISLRLP